MKKEESFAMIRDAESYHVFFYPFQWDETGSLEKAESEINMFNKSNSLHWNRIWSSNESDISMRLDNTHSGRMLYKTYQYFNNTARDLVLGRDDVALKYVLCNKDNIPIDGHMYITADGRKLDLPLLSVKLDIYEFGVSIISYEVVYKEKDEYIPLRDLLYNINMINEKGRRLFPPYLPDNTGGMTPSDGNQATDYQLTADCISMKFGEDGKILTQDFSKIANRLSAKKQNGRFEIGNVLPEYIEELIPFKEKNNIETVTDDRMFCCSMIMNDRVSKKVKCYCEGDCGDFTEELYKFAYVENFISCTSTPMRKRILQESIYDRWVEYGTIYASTHHSFMSIMQDASPKKPNQPVFLVENFVELYVPLVKIVLAQRAELLVFLKRAAELARNMKDYGKKGKIRLDESNRYKHDYSRFLNEFMLPEVSSEEQATDLYSVIQEQLYIKQVRESLTVQTQILYEITQSLVEDQEQKSSFNLQILLAFITIAGFWYGFGQIIGVFRESDGLAERIANHFLITEISVGVLLVSFVVIIIWKVIDRLKQ